MVLGHVGIYRTARKPCFKYIYAKVLCRLGKLSGSVAPAAWPGRLGGPWRPLAGLGRGPLEAIRGPSDGRDEGVREVET